MRDFFDKLYFGGYYVYILMQKSVDRLFAYPFKRFILLLGYIPFISHFAERQGKTHEKLMKESFQGSDKVMKQFDEAGFGHFQTGRLFGPMCILFWIDIALVPFLILKRNILPYPFKGANLILFAAAFGIISFWLTMGNDKRSRMVVKEYRKKPIKEQRKAFWLFIGMYVILMIPVILLIQYARKVGGW